ncbi:CIR protein PIR protein [Plasmodium vinckei lentum]|uniref:CIR protein PIR protein n=1 Tax=Plasmodium vinckei lentum TaxID=138297 RepID=A0A6V7T413_PLAVN|nr:CIR protein PIR protein [Plasmodium vinckei lentum]
MANEACKFLREVDDLFTEGDVDVDKFKNFTKCHSYCPYENKKPSNCKNNYERISALGGYLYNKLVSISNGFKGEGDNGNRHIEIFMMWLSNKLYKLEENKIKTLEEFYKEHLEKHTGNYKYWNVLGSKSAYKKANVWYMSELYSLLNYICNLITEYYKNPQNPNTKQIGVISNRCHQKFKTIYNDIRDCYSYFHLLKFLKNIYDGVRNAAVSAQKKPSKSRLLNYLISSSTIPIVELTTIDWNKRFPNQSDKILDFHTNECVKLYSEYVKKQQELESKKRQKAEPQTGSDKSGGKIDSNFPDNSKLKEDAPTKQVAKPTALKQKGRQPQRRQGQHRRRIEPRKPKPKVEPSPGVAQKQIQQPPAPQPLQQQRADSLPTGPPTESPTEQPTESPTEPPTEPPTDPSTDLPSSQNDPSLQKLQTGAPISGSSTSGGIFDFESSFLEFLLKGVDKFNKASEFIKDNQQRLNDAKDKISNVYNGAMDNLKKVYDKSNNYLNNFISNVTSHLNNNDAPSKPDGNQSEPGKSMNGGNSPIQLPSNSQPNSTSIMSPDPSPNPLPTPPQHLQLPPPPNSTQQKQSSSQTQPITHHPTSIDPPNHKTMVQLVKSPIFNLNLKKTWNIFPNTWNGSVDCKPEIKLMNATLVCCTPEKCSLTGISVTLVLIPIILSIAYKYLSREWTKKSEKKNMKRVIKLVDGNRKTQIIINSHDRSKDLKPVINSVDRKKDPLLNIYKLMQADPIPFINLFFLLIFFVYKRKSDFLEL